MSHEFHIGQKVVCVDANSGPGEWRGDEAPTDGAIYTVTDIVANPYFTDDWLHFAEIRRCPIALTVWGPRVGYGADRFRPLDDSRYDISIFQTMCAEAGRHAATPVKP